MKKSAWVLAGVGVSLVSLVSLGGVAFAQVQAKPKPPAVPANANTLKLRPVTVPPALKPALANKQKVTPAAIAQHLTYVGKTPLLRTKNGRQYALEPIDAPEPTASEIKPAAIPSSMQQKYGAYINAFTYGPAAKTGSFATIAASDHRANQSPIRDQARRGTCVAFASVAGLEAGYKKKGVDIDISENHAYNVFMPNVGDTCFDDKGIKTYKAADWLTGAKVCSEAKSPYVPDEQAAGSDCSIIQEACKNERRYGFDNTLQLFGAGGGTGNLSINNTNYLEAFLDMGFDIVGGFWLTGTDWGDGTAETGVVDVQTDANGNPLGGDGGHAMLIVGYNRPGNYFILKNSWGTDFGRAGYVYVSYEYMQLYAKYGYVVLSVYSGPAAGSIVAAGTNTPGANVAPVRAPVGPAIKK